MKSLWVRRRSRYDCTNCLEWAYNICILRRTSFRQSDFHIFWLRHSAAQSWQLILLRPCFNFINTWAHAFKGIGDKALQKNWYQETTESRREKTCILHWIPDTRKCSTAREVCAYLYRNWRYNIHRLCRLVCIFVFHIGLQTGFLTSRPCKGHWKDHYRCQIALWH